MPKWIHLHLIFSNHGELLADAAKHPPTGVYKDLMRYIDEIVRSVSPALIQRYFFLFEGNSPPLFLALELKDEKDLSIVEGIIGKKKKIQPTFVSDLKIDPKAKVGDPDEAIALYQAGTQYAFYRCSDRYDPPWGKGPDLIHLVHCFSNQVYSDWINEINFY